MKKIYFIFGASILAMTSCQSPANSTKEGVTQLMQEAIAVHDEIMPQIAHFDRTTVKIDSILANLEGIKAKDPNADTAAMRADLTSLKSNLENATDNMMSWMKDYAPDSTDIDYQKAEIEKIKAMKKQFDDVSVESNNKLGAF